MQTQINSYHWYDIDWCHGYSYMSIIHRILRYKGQDQQFKISLAMIRNSFDSPK